MTVALAESCAVCAAAFPAGGVCPRCGSRRETAGGAAGQGLPTLLSGGQRAGVRVRAAAAGLDAASCTVVSGLLVMAFAVGTHVPAAVLVWLGVGLLLASGASVWGVQCMTGRTVGKFALGLRTVDLFTGLPLGLRRDLLDRWTGSVVLDVRAGRDPTLAVNDVVLAPVRPGQGLPRATTEAPTTAPTTARTPAPTAAPTPAAAATTTIPVPTVPSPASVCAAPRPVAPARTPPARSVFIAFDDGQRFELSGTVLIGRNPAPGLDEKVDALVPFRDRSRSISKTHATLRWDGRVLWVGDRDSVNGTAIIDASGTREVGAMTEEAAAPGSRVSLGDRFLIIEPLVSTAPGGQCR